MYQKFKKVRRIFSPFRGDKRGVAPSSENIPFNSPYKRENKTLGFTLIESIIVMVVLAVAISGAVYLLGTVVLATERNKQQITAIYLAQECTELVRNLRDTAWKRHLPWDCMFAESVIEDEFIIEADHNAIAPPVCGNQMGMNFQKINDPAQSQIYLEGLRYTHHSSLGELTPFSRKVILKNLKKDSEGTNEELQASCRVEWEYRGNPQQVTMETLLTNWKK